MHWVNSPQYQHNYHAHRDSRPASATSMSNLHGINKPDVLCCTHFVSFLHKNGMLHGTSRPLGLGQPQSKWPMSGKMPSFSWLGSAMQSLLGGLSRSAPSSICRPCLAAPNHNRKHFLQMCLRPTGQATTHGFGVRIAHAVDSAIVRHGVEHSPGLDASSVYP